nr:MAG TPA: restriction endonuclease [Crassvirales sp.]
MKLCDIKRNNPYIFNSWRGILYTEKGKRVGTSEEWKDFLTFFNDVSPTYRKGLVLRRLYKDKPFSKENFIWVTNRIKDKKKGLECDLTIEDMLDIMNHPCVYCGDTKRIGCDRIDNSKGHTKDNVVPCCVECNKARSDYFSFEEMKKLGGTIREIKSGRFSK